MAPFTLDDRTVLVTGGTGSFGRKFIATILRRHRPRKVIVFSRDEAKQWDMSVDPAFRDRRQLRYFIGDVRDRERLEMAFRGVDYVVHAAALKHIPAAEYNPFECIQTNVYGAENVVRAAMRAGVQRVVALSTDKAANPINLYGASKLASDKIFVAAKHMVGDGEPLFAVVRYGNVVGSRGSVVPLFRRLIAEGVKALPITDPRMTRFWITLQQGVEFVLTCFATMQGGEIFVPKIPSMKLTELAAVMAPELPTETIGIRPGEKLHEAMITESDARGTLELPDRYVIQPPGYGAGRIYHPEQRKAPEDFEYASDSNPVWLTRAQMGGLLAELDG
jgi:UDP-N-acetylglucosamine 4,6-dehydratase